MSFNFKNKAADYSGVEGLYIPDHVTDIVISEAINCSTLAKISNPAYTISGLGLDRAPVAHYTILEGIEVGQFTGNQFNGETWEPDNPFRSGEITICQDIDIKKKFSRAEALAIADNWSRVQDGYERALGQALRNLSEGYGFRMIVSQAADFNQGNNAGLQSRNINLGTAAQPLQIGKGQGKISATAALERAELALMEAGVMCGTSQLRVVASPGFYSRLRSEQAVSGANLCCPENNPNISGILHPVFGFEVYSSLYMPRRQLPNGRTVEYVVIVNPEHIASPSDLRYLEWDTVLNDIYLIGNYTFDTAVLTGRSVAVLAVVLD